MTVVMVHGSPDRAEVWDALRARLDDVETVALRLPGFGTDPPEGFGATRWDYASWVAGEIERIGEPVDLVSHDIGSIVCHGVALQRPELLRTWACGSALCEPDYQWHVQARIWQTATLGEQSREAWLSLTEEQRLDVVKAGGVPADWAPTVAREFDARQFDVSLPFYRSAVYVGDWALPAEGLPPVAILWGREDQFQSVDFAERVAERIGAELHLFDSAHWWQLERPDEAAEALRGFWARQGSTETSPTTAGGSR